MNYIFYHLYYYNDAVARFAKTLEKIQNSGLYNNTEKIFVNVVGQSLTNASDLLAITNAHSKILVSNINQDPGCESDTLKFLWDTCQQLNREDNVLYLHSKGVTRTSNEQENKNVQQWIDLMEYFLIEKWQAAIEKLQDYDACGVNLQSKEEGHQHPHFSGNFWWASNAYIKRTKRWCTSYSTMKNNRMYGEFWLLDWCNVPDNRPYCLYHSRTCHYKHYYDPSNYRNKN